jgi:hypothetical protein
MTQDFNISNGSALVSCRSDWENLFPEPPISYCFHNNIAQKTVQDRLELSLLTEFAYFLKK